MSNDILLGSSVLRDMDENKLMDTEFEVICKRGGTIDTLTKVVESFTGRYDTMTLVVGGNDCHCDNKVVASPAEVVENYYNLMDSACQKAQKVVISSICPRLNNDDTQEVIQTVNEGLRATCANKERITFVDNTKMFTLGDGSINDGYLCSDVIHITKTAINKLV